MKEQDIQQLAERCRTLARNADIFTKKRLLDLALRYEAMYNKCDEPRGAPQLVSVSMKVLSQPITVRSIMIQRGHRPDQPQHNGEPGKASG
ncbi:MAG: hypothetical protein ACREDL_09125 [Bradyrhizobium sp.]